MWKGKLRKVEDKEAEEETEDEEEEEKGEDEDKDEEEEEEEEEEDGNEGEEDNEGWYDDDGRETTKSCDEMYFPPDYVHMPSPPTRYTEQVADDENQRDPLFMSSSPVREPVELHQTPYSCPPLSRTPLLPHGESVDLLSRADLFLITWWVLAKVD